MKCDMCNPWLEREACTRLGRCQCYRVPYSLAHEVDREAFLAAQAPRVRHIEVYADVGGRYRWRARAKNGKITAVSGEDFASKANARRAALREQAAWQGTVSVLE